MNISAKQEKIDLKTNKKLTFIDNALKDGWRVKYKNEKYIFTKKHGDKDFYFNDDYLNIFIHKMLI